MMKRLVYVFFVMISSSGLSFAKGINKLSSFPVKITSFNISADLIDDAVDTTKTKKPNQEADDKKKIKEIAKAKRQSKPEKLGTVAPTDTLGNKIKIKVRRQRRPEGLERPPEIPRRNNN
ncbi:hypothetical protein [Mucilaginibacter paludis]|uniref:Secreted protein n=1 Tax=Mucilaginibacter paludis DSM 18603 TaxID=714943 RepID=H1Y491_9SPHI|nr:hypothetical protein [Mucilaginibacter paludis]EHQ25725.1 hypothetical protein Mucpa_1567 [Mucilaginibacter paludis DSM 18603]